MIRRSWARAASIEETLALWAASLREVKKRIRPLFTQERVATNAGLFLEGLLGDEQRKTGWMRAEAAGDPELTERFESLSAELVAIPVDVLVAVTQPAALAAQRATTTIPIVFILVPEPVGSKLVKSLARPGGNITGLTNIAAELTAKRIQLLKEAFPRMTRVTLLVNPNDQQAMHRFIDEAKIAATALGLDVQPLEVRSLGEFEQAFDNMADSRSEGVITTPNGLFYLGRVLAGQLAVKRRLPLMVQNRETLEDGALMAYGPDIQVLFRRAAVYVDKILKGEKPADLPVEVPTKFQFFINLKTAKALGLTLPESLLLRADEAIE